MIRTACSPSFQNRFKESEARVKGITKFLALQVQTAGIDSSMRCDLEITNVLRGIADHVSNRHTVRPPVRFLQLMPKRSSVLDQMTTLFACQGSRLSSVALHGFAGCGTSSIVTEYVHRNLGLYDAVMCLDAGDQVKLERQVVHLARHLGFAAQGEDSSNMRKFVMDWLSTTDLRWLVVFDNADDRATLRAFWPTATHGAIIVTSRDPLVQDEGLATHAIRTQAVAMNDGADFLLSFLERPASSAAEDRAAACTITEHFSGWPMGLRTTATYIRSKRLTPARFVKLHDEQRSDHQQCSFLESSKMLWDLALKDIPDDARVLLDYLSLLDLRDIPVDFVDAPTFQFLNVRAWLSSRSLIGYDESGTFIPMDRYFQGSWLERLMKIPGRCHAALERVLKSLLEAVPEPDFEGLEILYFGSLWRRISFI